MMVQIKLSPDLLLTTLNSTHYEAFNKDINRMQFVVRSLIESTTKTPLIKKTKLTVDL